VSTVEKYYSPVLKVQRWQGCAFSLVDVKEKTRASLLKRDSLDRDSCYSYWLNSNKEMLKEMRRGNQPLPAT
jgi:prenyltransferase beta subunit